MNTRGNRLGAWLGHPATLIALLVLVVNDHVLKSLWPGPVTGKLSDAAGLVLAPPLLAVLIRRPAAALWSVGVGFFLVKAFPYAAELASAAWSVVHGPSLIRADPTDLLMLPFLAVAWWASISTTFAAAPRWLRALRMAVVLPLALVGVAATSAVQYPFATNVISTPDAIYLYGDKSYDSPEISRDNGVTWESISPSPAPSAAPTPSPSPSPIRRACSGTEPLICYRIVPKALGVERSVDGGTTWTTDWHVNDSDRKQLSRHYAEIGDLDEDLATLAVAVHDRRSGGHVVLAANGRDGYAKRDPDGRWQRIGFPPSDTTPPELGVHTRTQNRFELGMMISVITLLGGLVIIAGGASAATRARNRRSRWWLAPWLLPAGALLLLAFAYGGVDDWILRVFLLISPAVIILVTLGLSITVTANVHQDGAGHTRWAWMTWAAGAVTVLLTLGVWLVPGSPGMHLLFSVVCCLPGGLLAWRAARRIQPTPRMTAPPIPYSDWSGRSSL
ncbi:hypothetical protein [Actinoplanes sp. NBRC 103695]|uniref:hypothetical protein n=1 Tax=Actinoplanes sp. NBRC 103695 TaxID=3032202 RepID=UPI0024A2818C|nr:hypothetical protein [Actinoplanes sp. NBRC 103695]GLY95667.1 hypothetical protein Acsp02_29220 [Actinoplanes sp. NBRC 103695]